MPSKSNGPSSFFLNEMPADYLSRHQQQRDTKQTPSINNEPAIAASESPETKSSSSTVLSPIKQASKEMQKAIRSVEFEKSLNCTSSLQDQIDRVKLVKAYLNQVDWKGRVLHLPDICITPFNLERFEFTKSTIRMVNRVERIKTFVNNVENKSTSSLCLFGPAGCGKSFLLYQASCYLINRHCVVYVQKTDYFIPAVLRTLYVQCVSVNDISMRLKEILIELYNLIENITGKGLNEGEQLKQARDIIRRIRAQLTSQGKDLIFIIDQTNELFLNLPLNKVEILFLRDVLLVENHLLHSGSANNDIPWELEFKQKEEVALCFTRKELKAFIELFDFDLAKDHQERNEQIELIEWITGRMPIEVNRFINDIDRKLSFSQRISNYTELFKSVHPQSNFTNWFDRQPDHLKKDIAENMRLCFLEQKITQNKEAFDKRLVFRKYKNNQCFLSPISPLAYKQLFSAYDVVLRNTTTNEFHNMVTYGRLNPVERGFFIERYLIMLIRLGKLNKFPVVSSQPSMSAEKQLVTSIIEWAPVANTIDQKTLQTFDFAGRLSPIHQVELDVKSDVLFVPHRHTHPGFDFYIYKGDRKHAYFFNVTLQKKAFQHITKNDKKANKEKSHLTQALKSWLEFYPPGTKFFDIYIVVKKFFDETRSPRLCNVVFLEELAFENPGLEYISNYFKTYHIDDKDEKVKDENDDEDEDNDHNEDEDEDEYDL